MDNKKGPIAKVFQDLKGRGQKAFIPFLTCGFPDMEKFIKTYKVLDDGGADIIEIGIPFSDPLADGPVIQKTSKTAIDNGTNTESVFGSIKKIRKSSSTPIVLLTYFNMIYRYGTERFLSHAASAGANGVIIPDLPMEEYEKYNGFFKASGIDNIMIASLTSGDERLARISGLGRGFIYCVSLKGVTGARNGLSHELEDFLARLRSVTGLPLAVGFGISTTGQIKKIRDRCDGIIVGSKLLDILLKAEDFNRGLKELEGFVSEITEVLRP